MKKALFAVAAVALLAVSVQAGDIKTYQWPCTKTPIEITHINCYMDIGYWVSILNQDASIKLSQISIHEYEGYTDLKVKANTEVVLSVTIASTGAIGGTPSAWIDGSAIVPPGGVETKVTVKAKFKDADLSGIAGGTNNVHVATVTVWVVPTS